MKTLEELAISENNFIFDPTTGQSYKVNTLGKKIIHLMIKGLSEQEIMGQISEAYGIEEDQVYLDITDFMIKLKIFGLIK